MKTKLILIDGKTGMYFTNSYENDWWSKNISDARFYDNIEDVKDAIDYYKEDGYLKPFNNVSHIGIMTIIVL